MEVAERIGPPQSNNLGKPSSHPKEIQPQNIRHKRGIARESKQSLEWPEKGRRTRTKPHLKALEIPSVPAQPRP